MALTSDDHAHHLAITQFKSPWRLAECGDLNGLQAMARTSPTVQLDLVDVAHGWTPIMFAASRNWSRVVSWLQRRGANVHRATGDGLTCVWLAATAGSVDVLRLLIRQYKCDLDVDHQDS